MKALVLGGSGFIGSHLVDVLLDNGVEVAIFSRSRGSHTNANASFHEADFQDTSKLAEALDGVDVVVHCISTTVPATSALDPCRDVNSNLIGTINLLELMRKKDIRRLIYLSSGGTVYGPSQNPAPVTETAALNPISSYGAVKVAIENFIQIAQIEWNLSATILRPSNPYGERQGHKGVQGLIGTLFQKYTKNEPVTIYGDGSTIRDYLYIKDLANLIVRAVLKPENGVFNCGSGVGHTVNEIIELFEGYAGTKLEKVYKDARPFDVKGIVLNNQKALDVFGWKSTTPIAVGIKNQFKYLSKLST